MPQPVAKNLDQAIEARLKFVPLPAKTDFEKQLEGIKVYLAALEKGKTP
jgi:hypothetical protein